MPNAEKVKTVAEIKADIEAADAIWVVDYRGLTVKQSEALRGIIRQQGATFKVYKNSFTERALGELGLPALGAVLEGPSAFVFVSGDPVNSAKALKDFAKANNALEIKGGLLGSSLVDASQIKAIADLPSREELIAKLLGTMNNPMSSLVRVLNGPATQFVRTLQAVAEKAA
ncbi:MAG: 50S ribosomal protein L10 [Coriobacteriales bacterium]|jgi:large subunit ribosomal protein L10|nr:50S ribosomal protein L10 [Coriobacteriales bacterium]